MPILRLLGRIQERTKLIVNDGRLSNFIDLLKHLWNIASVSLFYSYCNGFCLSEIRGLVFENHVFLLNTCYSRRTRQYIVDWPVDRTLHYRQTAFFSRTIRMRNSLCAEFTTFLLWRAENGIKYKKNHHRC